jgi:hydrogen peroxide-dependent heme synthase
VLTVPESLEGWCLLHQMFRVSWPALAQAANDERAALAAGLQVLLEQAPEEGGSSMAVAMLGHKADLMLVHARKSFDALVQAQLDVARLPIAELFEATTSYVSVIELGMYEMTTKIHEQLVERGLELNSDEYRAAMREAMQAQQGRVSGRLFTAFPARRYVSFYPMDKRRGEVKNWYSAPFDKRAAMMREHGQIGRLYAGDITQIISGSIGFDDWEWGVDLFADDPLVFKKLIYEMRFDEASADYGEFGPFYTGVQFSPSQVAEWVEGRTPTLVLPNNQ